MRSYARNGTSNIIYLDLIKVCINSTIKEQTLNLTILISLFALETGRMRTQARKKKKNKHR